MQKIMFDSNAFSSFLKHQTDWGSFFSKCRTKYEFYVTAVQVEELANIPDAEKEKRIQHLLLLAKMRAKIVPTILVLDYSRLGLSVLANENDNTYELLLKENRSNVHDALIGEAAKREGCLLITDDKWLVNRLNKVGIKNICFENFIKNAMED